MRLLGECWWVEVCVLLKLIPHTNTQTPTPVGGLFGGPGGLDQQQLLEMINQGVLGPLDGGIGRALAEAGG